MSSLVIKNSTPNKKQMLELANSGYTSATDLADYLVKNHSMSFRKAYQKTAEIVNFTSDVLKRYGGSSYVQTSIASSTSHCLLC